jgi:hypothetical protein
MARIASAAGHLTMPDGALHSNIVAGLAGIVISTNGIINPLTTSSGGPILVDP